MSAGRAGILGLLAALVVTYFFILDDFQKAGIGSIGFRDSGSKFGVEIGVDLTSARSHLTANGLRLYEEDFFGQCLGFSYPKDQDLEVWVDETWRYGSICLASVGEKVVSIRWHYTFDAP